MQQECISECMCTTKPKQSNEQIRKTKQNKNKWKKNKKMRKNTLHENWLTLLYFRSHVCLYVHIFSSSLTQIWSVLFLD